MFRDAIQSRSTRYTHKKKIVHFMLAAVDSREVETESQSNGAIVVV